MNKKKLKELEKATADQLPELLHEMTSLLEKHGIEGMRVFSFEMEPAAKLPEAVPTVNRVLNTRNAPGLSPGCVLLPNGKIFCG